MGVSVTTKVELSGNFFVRDPSKTLYRNIGDMLEALAGEMPGYSGWSYDHTVGYVKSGLTGKRWATWAAVGAVTAGMSKKDAIRTKAAAASIERRWHPYRRVKSAVYRSRSVLSADLARGLE